MDNGLHFPVDGDTACLFYGHKRTQTLYSVSPYNPKASLKRIPQLRHKVILDYSHGWFVLRDSNDMTLFFLYNPVTLDLINLPPLLAAQSIKDISGTLKSPPDCDDCVLILCASHEGPLFLCSPSKPDFGWLTQRLEFDGESLFLLDYLTLHGVFYVVAKGNTSHIDRFYELDLDVSSSRVIFRPSKQLRVPSFEIIKGGSCSDNIFVKYFVVESCGQVYFIWLSAKYSVVWSRFELKTIKVFELDSCSSTTREIKSLNGRSFFLRGASSTWCWGNTDDLVLQSGGGIQRNCIYLVLSDDDNLIKLYLYNLIDQTLMPLRHGPDLFKPIHYPVWVIPQQLRLLSMNERIKKVENPRHHGVLGRIEGQQTRFADLPIHLVERFSKFIHLFEYWNFRASCKVFRSLCPAPRWRTNNATPLFMVFDQHNIGSCKMVDPHRTDPRFSTLPLSPFPFTVKFSNRGWLLNIVDQEHFEFYNIFTGARGKSPPLDRVNVKSIGFSTYPTDPDCLTVAVDTNYDGRVLVYFYLPKLKGWIERGWIDSQFSVSESSNPVFLDGAFYVLDTEGNLGVYRKLKGKLTLGSWNVYDKPETIVQFHSCNLVECEGKLYSVFIDKVSKWVRLYRFDETVMSWTEINCLENHCFFISRASSFSTVARDPTMRNRIYLPRFRGNRMIYYSLDTRKFHVLGSEGFLENLFGTSEPMNCCWM